MIESLTSYMARLAQEHSISVKDLISPHLMACFARGYLVSPHGTGSSSWSRASRAINGTGVWARDAVRSLESLVGRSDLAYLTMLPWAAVIPARGMLKKSKAWCPACYREWNQDGSPIHDPLIWFLTPVRMCMKHQRELETACPQCGRGVPYLSSRAIPSHCPACGAALWLEASPEGGRGRSDPRYHQWQAWITDQLGKLLTRAEAGGRVADRKHLRAFYRSCAKHVFGGSSSEMARLFQVSPRTAREWIAGTQLPTLENLLVSCYCFQVAAGDVLSGVAEVPSLETVRMPLWSEHRPQGRLPRVLDKDAIRPQLEQILDANYLFPPSMVDVSRFLDIDASHLSRLFPGLCKQISRRYLAQASSLRSAEFDRTKIEVRNAVNTLVEAGIYPGYDPVSSQLARPWLLRRDEVNAIWKTSLEEIAYRGRETDAMPKGREQRLG